MNIEPEKLFPQPQIVLPEGSYYTGEDGQPHCSVCFEPLTLSLSFASMPRVIRRECACAREKRRLEEEADAAARRLRLQEKRLRECFEEPAMRRNTFANDATPQQAASRCARQWAADFADKRKRGQGAVLLGPVGTGKTYLAAAIANQVIQDGYSARMLTPGRYVSRLLTADLAEREELIRQMMRCDLLIIDDIGTQRESSYAYERLFELVDARYDGLRPIIITTNQSWSQMSHPDTIQQDRLYDRLLHRADVISVTGTSRRKQKDQPSWARSS